MKKVAVALVLVVAVVAAGIYLTRTTEPDTRVEGLVPGAVEPFGSGNELEPGPFDASYNRAGTLLAVRGVTGISLADRGRLRTITEVGIEISAYAWIPSSEPVLIYAEAPGSTGQLRLVRADDGESLGTIPLDPVVRVRALSVATDRRQAVLVVADRDALAPKDRLDLATADLKLGTVTLLPRTDEDELDVRHIDDRRVLVKLGTEAGAEAVVVNLETGERRRVSREGELVEHIDVLSQGRFIAYAARTRASAAEEPGAATVWAVSPNGGDHIKMGSAGRSSVVAIDPRGGAAVVSDLVSETDDTFSRRLRRIELNPLPDPPAADAP